MYGAIGNDLLVWGLWVDGVPVKFDRSESLECISLKLPHLNETDSKTMRLPVTRINKNFAARMVAPWMASCRFYVGAFIAWLKVVFQRWTIKVYHSKMHGGKKWLVTGCWLLEPWLRFEVIGRCINKFSGFLLGVKLDIAVASAGPSWLIFEIAQLQHLGEQSLCMILN